MATALATLVPGCNAAVAAEREQMASVLKRGTWVAKPELSAKKHKHLQMRSCPLRVRKDNTGTDGSCLVVLGTASVAKIGRGSTSLFFIFRRNHRFNSCSNEERVIGQQDFLENFKDSREKASSIRETGLKYFPSKRFAVQFFKSARVEEPVYPQQEGHVSQQRTSHAGARPAKGR